MKTAFNLAAILAVFLLSAGSGKAQSQDWKDEEKTQHSYAPSNAYVADETTAIAIAEAILVPIYGKDAIERQKPYFVSLENDVWTVSGQRQTVPGRTVVGGDFRI